MKLTPPRLLLCSFAGLIALGTIALLLPGSSAMQRPIAWHEALFTATSAVCVTGLTVLDTGSQFTLQGQVIILALIQLGGLGILTLSSWFLFVLGQRLSLRGADTVLGSFSHSGGFRIKDLLPRILVYTFTIEFAGAVLLWARLGWEHPLGEAIYSSIFHSISAFNNAGFSLYPDSLNRFHGDIFIIAFISILIMLGGIGYQVMVECMFWWKERIAGRRYRLSLHTRLVLLMSSCLTLFGTLAFLILENSNSFSNYGILERILVSFFEAVTCRTAGFNSIDTSSLTMPTLCVMIFLMFIGGAPGSTAGGLKVTTFGILLAIVWARMRGRTSIQIFHRRIPQSQVAKSISTAAAGVCGLLLLLFSILITESLFSGQPITDRHLFLDYLFESVSALGTVGLSTGVTPELSVPGRLFITLAMFAGRLGPLSLAISLIGEPRPARYEYPEETVMVG